MKPTIGIVAEAELTAKEQAKLERTEHVIDQAQRSFYDFGKGLAVIHAEKLYRPMTWEQYLSVRWDSMSHDRARQLMGAAAVVDLLTAYQKKVRRTVVLPTNEWQCRTLIDLEEKQLYEVWETITDTLQGRLTSGHINKHVSDLEDKNCQKQYEVPTEDYSDALAVLPPKPDRRPAAPSQPGSERAADTCVARCRDLAERQAKLGEKLEDEEKASWFVWNALWGQRILDGDFPPKAWLKNAGD